MFVGNFNFVVDTTPHDCWESINAFMNNFDVAKESNMSIHTKNM